VGKDTLAASEPYRFYICKRGAYKHGCLSYCVGANLHLTNSVSLSHALTHSLTFISNIYIYIFVSTGQTLQRKPTRACYCELACVPY
jgi:hypothetical protein